MEYSFSLPPHTCANIIFNEILLPYLNLYGGLLARGSGDGRAIMTTEEQFDDKANRPDRLTALRLGRIVVFGAAGVALIALAGLIGYVPGMQVMGRIRLDYVPMAPSTACCFFILAAVLFRQARRPRQGSSLMVMLVLLVTIFCLLDLIGELVGADLNYEERLFSGIGTLRGIPIGLMSPATSTTFIVAGLGSLLLLFRSLRLRNTLQRLGDWGASLGLLTMLIGATVLLAYLYGTPFMYRGTTIPMAATTAIAFLLLGSALVATAGSESFPLCLVTGDSTSALLLRVFLPLTVIIAFLHTTLSRFASAYPAINEAFLLAILVVAAGTITVSVVAFTSHSLGKRLDKLTSELRLSEEQHQSILLTAMDGFWLVNMQGQLLEVNDTYCRMSGYSTQELLNLSIFDLEANESHNEIAAQIQKIVEWGNHRFESRHRRKDGTCFDVEISAQYHQEKGRLVAFLRDITDRKRAEVDKAKLEDQLQQSQKMESVGRLAGGVAHDFNNMLSVIRGYAELTLDAMDPIDPLYANLQQIHTAAERSSNLTRQLLAFARKQAISPKVLDLNETVEGMLKMLRRLIGEDIQLQWLPENGVWPVSVDPSQIDQILANLCVNSRDSIRDIGKITIETGNCAFDEAYCADHPGYMPGEYVQLVVSDNGCGMDKETLCHIFEPFYTTKSVGEGTGLGLATVYGAVKQNSGFVRVYSEVGHGTTFTIYLPRHGVTIEQAAVEMSKEPLVHGDKTILLVEDEPAILEMITLMLRKQGYSVLSANRPEEAIRIARESADEIHLLMTDVIMPEMNGRELAENLLSLYPSMKRLFMSGYTADVIAHHGVLDAGVCFLQKPFSTNQMAAKVREALES